MPKAWIASDAIPVSATLKPHSATNSGGLVCRGSDLKCLSHLGGTRQASCVGFQPVEMALHAK